MIVLHALFGYVDSAAALEALNRLAPLADGPISSDPAIREDQDGIICAREWWRLARGETRSAREAIARLGDGRANGCAVVLEALLAQAERRPDAAAAFARVDSLCLSGVGRAGLPMAIAQWYESRGDHRRAYQSVRRRGYQPTLHLAHALREEGRLADLAGEREGAIAAYAHHLRLRYVPEPSVAPEVARIRAELARPIGERD